MSLKITSSVRKNNEAYQQISTACLFIRDYINESGSGITAGYIAQPKYNCQGSDVIINKIVTRHFDAESTGQTQSRKRPKRPWA
jgi:hypothetical protein